ncbi:MAG: serine/threonine-protein kinase, partial [Polyangiaceae bacterium]
MATVHLGRLQGPVGFSRTVAIKRLHDQFAGDPEFVSSFLDEARIAARIRHPNVVPTLDVVAADGQLFLVMEYVQGESLSRLIRATLAQKDRMPVGISVTIAAAALHGLHAAHEATSERGEPLHIVHRDVSPQNVIVGIDGVARVLDFGVAKAVGRLQNTRDGQLKGKIPYMSPEQLRGGVVDRRTDIYATAVVLWEALATRRAFTGDSDSEILGRAMTGIIDPPSKYAPDVSPELDAIVMRGLERKLEARWPTAREMAVALEAVAVPATSTQIGAWVERTAKASLEFRAQAVKEIESGSIPSDHAAHLLSEIRKADANSGPEVGGTDRSMSTPTPGVTQPRRVRSSTIALLLAILSGLTVTLVLRECIPRKDALTTAAAVEPVAGSAPVAASVATESASPIAPVTPSSSTTAESAAAASALAAKHAHPRPAHTVDCSTPFTWDD